jgi:hypothetical protein
MKTTLIKLQLASFMVAALLPTHAAFGSDKWLGNLGGVVNARGIDPHHIKCFINYDSTLPTYLCLSANVAALCVMNSNRLVKHWLTVLRSGRWVRLLPTQFSANSKVHPSIPTTSLVTSCSSLLSLNSSAARSRRFLSMKIFFWRESAKTGMSVWPERKKSKKSKPW